MSTGLRSQLSVDRLMSTYRLVTTWLLILIPLLGLVLAFRARVWQWPAARGFLLWLAVNLLGNAISTYVSRVMKVVTYEIGLIALPLQVLAVAVALCGLATDRRHCRRVMIGTGIYLAALAAALLLGEVSHWSLVYLFRSPYALFVVVGCGYAYVERTARATVSFRSDGARLALVGVLVAVVPVLVLELAMWGMMQFDEMAAAQAVSGVRVAVMIGGYLLVALSFRQPWTFARSG